MIGVAWSVKMKVPIRCSWTLCICLRIFHNLKKGLVRITVGFLLVRIRQMLVGIDNLKKDLCP